MNSIKLLISSFTMTFLTLITIAPAIAAPAVKVQHLQVSNMTSIVHTSYNSMVVADKAMSKFPTQYSNNFSTGLILSSSKILSEEHAQTAITVVNKSNDFFASAMIVSDKVNQFISYFTSSEEKKLTEQAEPIQKSEVMRSKCSKTDNLS